MTSGERRPVDDAGASAAPWQDTAPSTIRPDGARSTRLPLVLRHGGRRPSLRDGQGQESARPHRSADDSDREIAGRVGVARRWMVGFDTTLAVPVWHANRQDEVTRDRSYADAAAIDVHGEPTEPGASYPGSILEHDDRGLGHRTSMYVGCRGRRAAYQRSRVTAPFRGEKVRLPSQDLAACQSLW